MAPFGTLVIWLHLAAIIAWVGGLLAVYWVCVPVLMREARPQSARLVARVVHRFQRISWELVAVIVVTGIFNVLRVGVARGFGFDAAYVGMLVGKLCLLVAIVALQAWQSFRLVPAFVAVASNASPISGSEPPEFTRFRRRAFASSLLAVVLAAIAVFLGLLLRYR